MNSVEKVLNLCKERKIAISKLEKECGFANGYIRQLKKGTFTMERLLKIAGFFGLPIEYFYDDREYLPSTDPELDQLLEQLKNRPECRMLFKLAADATADDVRQAVRIIEAIRRKE